MRKLVFNGTEMKELEPAEVKKAETKAKAAKPANKARKAANK